MRKIGVLFLLMPFLVVGASAQDFPVTFSVLPPAKPAFLKNSAPEPENRTTQEAAPVRVQPVAAPAPSLPVTEEQAIDRANAYFNTITTLSGDFVQVSGDGRRFTGKLFVQKPGKLRFDYETNPVEVIADGTSVAVRDRKLATQDLYPIGQTPLKFLTRAKVDLARDVTMTGAALDPGGVRLNLEDRSTLGGTSKIALYFDRDMETLQQWRITDPQGGQTSVVLSNVQKGLRLDPKLFVIDTQQQIFDRR